MVRLSLMLLLLVAPGPALAWGEYAHRLTASIAQAELTPRARREVRRILAQGVKVNTPACPLATLEDAAVWPDCVRALPDRFADSFAWHYQNIDICRPFDIAAKCPDGNCVTAQIPLQLAVVADRGASPSARAEALAFLTHFVGDMHQPLHIGEKSDRGGNDVQAAYGAKAPERMNLHRIWDSELAERALTEPPAIRATSPTPAERLAWTQGSVEAEARGSDALVRGSVQDWARESWTLSRTLVYPALGDDPASCAAAFGRRTIVDAAYVAAASETVRRQVERAGVRLAVLLNLALAR